MKTSKKELYLIHMAQTFAKAGEETIAERYYTRASKELKRRKGERERRLLRQQLGQLRVAEILADMAWEAEPTREYSQPALLGGMRGWTIKRWVDELADRVWKRNSLRETLV